MATRSQKRQNQARRRLTMSSSRSCALSVAKRLGHGITRLNTRSRSRVKATTRKKVGERGGPRVPALGEVEPDEDGRARDDGDEGGGAPELAPLVRQLARRLAGLKRKPFGFCRRRHAQTVPIVTGAPGYPLDVADRSSVCQTLGSCHQHDNRDDPHQSRRDRGRALRRGRAEDRRELRHARAGRASTTASSSTASSPISWSRAAIRPAPAAAGRATSSRTSINDRTGRPRRARHGERRPEHERQPVLHRHRRRGPLARRQAHRLRAGHVRDGRRSTGSRGCRATGATGRTRT